MAIKTSYQRDDLAPMTRSCWVNFKLTTRRAMKLFFRCEIEAEFRILSISKLVIPNAKQEMPS